MSEWLREVRETVDEASVEIGKSKESLDVLQRAGDALFLNGSYLGGIHLDAVGGNDQPEKFDLRAQKFGLRDVHVEPCVGEPLDDFKEVLLMLLLSLTEDNDIVKVGHAALVEVLV